MSRKKVSREGVPVSFRLPLELQKALLEKARQEDLNFSQLARRALRREVTDAGIPVKEAA
jgi:post-segregation antitoxin (ccd killing protein)